MLDNSTQREMVFISLKSALKAKEWTYRKLADRLGVSEISVKRIFSKRETSLERLIQICDLLELSLFDLISHAQKRIAPTYTLSPEEELFFIDNFPLFQLYRKMESHSSLNDFLDNESLNWSDIKKSVLQLEKTGLLEITDNQIRCKYKGHLTLSPQSKLSEMIKNHWTEKLFKRIQQAHQDNPLQKDHKMIIMSTGLSAENRQMFYQEFMELIDKYLKLGHIDQKFKDYQKLGISLLSGPYRVGELD